MKKILKKEVIIAFIIGVLIASGITVYATSYLAKDITYTREGTNIKSVEEALNDLYENKNDTLIKNIDLSKVDFSSANVTFNGTNTYQFNDDYDMVLIASRSASDCGNHYYINDTLITNTRWISDGSQYIMSGIIINVKKGDLLKTDAPTFPTSINLLKQK